MIDSYEISHEEAYGKLYDDTLIAFEVKKELIEKINASKFGPISKEKPQNDLVKVIPKILESILDESYVLESTCKSITFTKKFYDKYEAQKEFANILYKHLSDNRWITLDKRSIKEIIDSGIFVDFDFKLELKKN